MCITETDLLSAVFDGLTFPAARWQLTTQARQYGVDADTYDRLSRLPEGTYRDVAQVAGMLRAAQPTVRPLRPIGPAAVHPLRRAG